ncbi:MAG: DsbA family protein [Actinomycetia bacterium]|jgi:protein-disulfide isomerase|nr:DsbA family protein [Actinomycetes bacterium]
MSSTPRESKRTARERLAEERAAQQAAERRREQLIRFGLIAVVFLVVAGVGLAVWASNRTSADPDARKPAGAQEDGGLPFGEASTPVIEVYEDFQCPACAQFEANVGETIVGLQEDGKAKVVYHVLSFLDDNLGNDSSFRAANAAGCAQEQGTFIAYHDTVYANQPATEGDGFTDEQLLSFAETAGVPDQGAFETCVQESTFGGWVDLVQANATDSQITGTPTIVVGGEKLDLSSAQSWEDVSALLTKAVEDAS